MSSWSKHSPIQFDHDEIDHVCYEHADCEQVCSEHVDRECVHFDQDKIDHDDDIIFQN